MRILLLDIETAPALAYVWSLWKQTIAINQLEENGYVLCWSAKWLGEDKIHFASVQNSDERTMLSKIHKLVSEADIIVHYNGNKFDIPTLNREWLRHGFAPPAPARHVDLYQVCSKSFRFISNKLDYISQYLGIGEKVKHTGHELWTGCLKGDKQSWKTMKEYNIQDVLLLEGLYERLRPWITNHPSHAADSGVMCCPACGSENFQMRGYSRTAVHKYRRYQCTDCGKWFRGTKTVFPRLAAGEERVTNIPSV